MTETNVALIGCGFFATNHLHSWQDLKGEGANLVAVCDIDGEKARAAAEKFGVPNWYTDAGEMLEKEKIDLLDIATRMDTHRKLAEMSISRGIATIVQKPFAPTIEDCAAIVSAARKAGVFLAVHENFRFQAPMLRAAEVIRSGVLGEPTWGRVSFRTGYGIYKGQPYFYDEDRFVILDLGVHVLDMARVLLGEATRVSCETQKRNGKVKAEDTATMMMRHENGAVSIVEATYESQKLPDTFPQTLLEIECTNGALVMKPGLIMEVTHWPKGREGSMKSEHTGTPLLPWTSEPWHTAQESVLNTCRHLLERFREGRDADISGEDNLKTFALAEAAYASAASGRAVAPPSPST